MQNISPRKPMCSRTFWNSDFIRNNREIKIETPCHKLKTRRCRNRRPASASTSLETAAEEHLPWMGDVSDREPTSLHSGRVSPTNTESDRVPLTHPEESQLLTFLNRSDRLDVLNEHLHLLPKHLRAYASNTEGSRIINIDYVLERLKEDIHKQQSDTAINCTQQVFFPFYLETGCDFIHVPALKLRSKQYLKRLVKYWIAMLSVDTHTDSFDIIAAQFYSEIKDFLNIKWRSPIIVLAKLKFDTLIQELSLKQSLTLLNDLVAVNPYQFLKTPNIKFNAISVNISDARWQFRALQLEWFDLSCDSTILHSQIGALTCYSGKSVVTNDLEGLLRKLTHKDVALPKEVLVDTEMTRGEDSLVLNLEQMSSRIVGMTNFPILNNEPLNSEHSYYTVSTRSAFPGSDFYDVFVNKHFFTYDEGRHPWFREPFFKTVHSTLESRVLEVTWAPRDDSYPP